MRSGGGLLFLRRITPLARRDAAYFCSGVYTFEESLMKLRMLFPITACLLLGCSSQPPQQKPIPITTQSSPSDAQPIEQERQREKQMPYSAEWLKTATDAQKKECLKQSSINQAMDALSAHPPSKKTTPSASTNKQ
jgi:hypothetical protein